MKHKNERYGDLPISENSFPVRLIIESGDNRPIQPTLHRHRECELLLVLHGSITVHFPTESAERVSGGIFINSGVPHAIQFDDSSALVASVLFSDEIISPDGSISGIKYVKPLISDAELSHILLDVVILWQRRILELLGSAVSLLYHYSGTKKDISVDIPQEDSACFELDVQSRLSAAWSLLYSNLKGGSGDPAAGNEHAARKRTRMMTDFIRDNYRSQISLAEIAASANISKSEASRCFQSCLNTSPVSYLLQYRVDTAAYLLQNTGMTIEAISFECGFGSSSYFCKMFQRYTGTTPGRYRRDKHRE